MLDGGPRAGQLVDDLPDGYAPSEARQSVAALFVGDIPAVRAIWRQSAPRLRLVSHDG